MSTTQKTTLLRPEEMKFSAEAQAIQDAAGAGIVKVVTLGQLVFFSAPSGDAWMLDPEDGLAAPLAHAGEPCPIPIQESPASLWVNWSADYRIDGDAFIVIERASGSMRAILGYPTALILHQIQEHAAAAVAHGVPAPAVDAAQERLKTARNLPCPCGSGRKYKSCHRAQDLDLVNRAGSPGSGPAPATPTPDRDPFRVRRDALWKPFKALKKPSRAQMDELLEGLLALPPNYIHWFEVIHAVGDHPDLPGVFRRIADAVPHTAEAVMGYFYWAAAEEFASHGLHDLLPEVLERFCRLEGECFQPEALDQIEELLLAEGCEQETLQLAEHFLARSAQGADLPTYEASEQRELIFELRAGQAVQDQTGQASVEEVTRRLAAGMAEHLPPGHAGCCAAVICAPAGHPAWKPADFDIQAAAGTEDVMHLYERLLRVAGEAAREDGVRAGRAFRGLSLLLQSILAERQEAEEPRRRKEKKRAPPNLLDYLAGSKIEPRVAERCRDMVGINKPRARLLLDAHQILIRFAGRHRLMPAADAAGSESEVARLLRFVT
jgi:hypothetical protein